MLYSVWIYTYRNSENQILNNSTQRGWTRLANHPVYSHIGLYLLQYNTCLYYSVYALRLSARETMRSQDIILYAAHTIRIVVYRYNMTLYSVYVFVGLLFNISDSATIIMYYIIIALHNNIPSGWSDVIIIRAGSDIQICFHDVAKHGTPRVLHIII